MKKKYLICHCPPKNSGITGVITEHRLLAPQGKVTMNKSCEFSYPPKFIVAQLVISSPSVLLAWAHPTSSNVFKLWWSIDRILQQCLCWNGVSLSIKQPFHLSHWKRRQRNGFSLSSASIYQLIFTLPSSPTGDPQQVCSILPFWQFWLGMDDCPLHAKDRCELLKSKLELQSSLICPVLYWAAKEMDPSV